MYNEKAKCWLSEENNDRYLADSEVFLDNKDPAIMFALADTYLASMQKDKKTSEAVYLMESAAKAGYSKAAFAMGQMFHYGWAVHKSPKKAEEWYEKAVEFGYTNAKILLKKIKKQRQRNIIFKTTAFVLIVGVVVLIVCSLILNRNVEGILINEKTELINTTTQNEFCEELNELVSQYDDESVISGQQSSNRLLLKFEGDGIDLRKFPAKIVLSNNDNYLIIQFETEKEASSCLDYLRKNKNVIFADMDEYENLSKQYSSPEHTSTTVPYHSPYTDEYYYSWGVEFLGYDRLAKWISTQDTKPVIVAVIDTGSEPCNENQHRYLDGIDITNATQNEQIDENGHGTHVAGTVIDCTRGLDVSIMPIKVFSPEGTAPTTYIVEGIRYAIENNVDVINMSLGGDCPQTDDDNICGDSKDYFIQEAIDKGIVVVVAAGNGDEYGNPENTNIVCPAHINNVIVVSACDSNGKIASFSNFGNSVDVCAPGVNVLSYYPGDTFECLDGTSMATPHISALAAMLKLYMPDRMPAQIEKYIKDYCTDMGDELYYGEGIPWADYFAGN